jgi:predicted mannosyl-3-phosphoglycerate phosphatase (HAD superfamily)
MLAPRQILFTSVDDLLSHASGKTWESAGDCLQEVSRRRVPLILCTRGTRAELDSTRRKLGHSHPFLTESGRGLFIPDGYFNLRLEGADRCGRNFCVPFAKPTAEAATALAEIAEECGASVVGLSQMSVREISNNCGLTARDAELYRQREFGELFFFAGETEATTKQFSEMAREKGWQAVSGSPFWELCAPLKHHGDDAVHYLMNVFRKTLRGRQRSVGIGSKEDDLYYLSAMDAAVILPRRAAEFDSGLLARLPKAHQAELGGIDGWCHTIAEQIAPQSNLREGGVKH